MKQYRYNPETKTLQAVVHDHKGYQNIPYEIFKMSYIEDKKVKRLEFIVCLN